MALEPITRQEKIIAGQDLTPITRMEKFLKEFGGSGGGVSSWNDLTDKPFYEEASTVEVLAETALIVDADLAEGFIFTNPITLEAEKTYNINYNGVSYSCVANELAMEGKTSITLGNMSVIGGEDTGEPFALLVFPADLAVQNGFYMQVMPLDEASSVTISIYQETTVTHPIEGKYLPKALQFGEKENVIFPETTVTFTPMEEAGGMFVFMTAFPTAFKPFEYYTVNYNGVDYTCKSSENGAVGNGLVGGGEDTGEPFAMASHEGMLTVISLTGETSATMSIRYHATDKIELKYIPEPDMLDLVSLGLPTVHACYKENGAVISDGVRVSINYEQFKEIEKKLLTGSIWAKIKVSCKYDEDAFGNGGQGLKEVECETLFRVCEKTRSGEYDLGLAYSLYAIVGSIFFIDLTIISSDIFAKMYRLNILPEDRS